MSIHRRVVFKTLISETHDLEITNVSSLLTCFYPIYDIHLLKNFKHTFKRIQTHFKQCTNPSIFPKLTHLSSHFYIDNQVQRCTSENKPTANLFV